MKKTKVVYKKISHRVKGRRLSGYIEEGGSTIFIEERDNQRVQLGTLIHERLHQLLPDASETEILRLERALARLVWDQGYRRG